MKQCFECEKTEDQIEMHDHHVVPRSKGGTKTIPLCCECHGLVHGKNMMNMGELTRRALADRKVRGMRAGKIPYGFKAGEGKFLAIEESEIKVLRKMDDLRSRGVSYAKMVSYLNDKGILNRHGRTWKRNNLYVCYQGWCEDGRDRFERLSSETG